MKYYLEPEYLKRSNIYTRIAGILHLIVFACYYIWIINHLNFDSAFSLGLSILFLIATSLTVLFGIILVINNWNFTMPRPELLERGSEPRVAILVPTYDESEEIVLRTVKSIVNQDWPKEKRIIIIGDDGHRESLKQKIEKFKLEFDERDIIYHEPPHKKHPDRRGEAKAGNLNATLRFIQTTFPDIEFVETRDADDLVGTPYFLRYCLNFLLKNPNFAFVQTIKRCSIWPGDPFSNQEAIFYERMMPVRHATNAVFPCGSGLVWRIAELEKIGGFPAWNLVEDLQSGFEILRRGGSGAFLPIVGAVGQIAPEDIPNFYKQRGTWAVDTLRLFYWRNPFFTSGLNFRQKLQFFELEFSYLLSFAMAIFIINIVASLAFEVYPISSSPTVFALVTFAVAVFLEFYNVIRARGISYKKQWRSRQTWLGLMPIFIWAAIVALGYGPNKKPLYRTTRKYHQFDWYWRETIIQYAVIISLYAAIIIDIVRNHYTAGDYILIFWALFFIYGFSQVVRNSWHRIDIKKFFTHRPV